MFDASIRVLLIEDDPQEAELVAGLLAQVSGPQMELSQARDLASAQALLRHQRCDVVLLDVTLPGSQDIEQAVRIFQDARHVPVVVLTRSTDDRLAAQLVRLGAQDYLPKRELTPPVLLRSIRFAMARSELQHARLERDWLAAELQAFEKVSGLPAASVTARIFGQRPLRETSGKTHAELVTAYAGVLRECVEANVYKQRSVPTGRLRELADTLTFYRAGPRDVIEVHLDALRVCSDQVTAARARALSEESRLLVLELMGHVVQIYRAAAVDLPPPAGRPGAAAAGSPGTEERP